MGKFQKSINFIRQAVENSQIPSAALAIGDRNHVYVKEVFGKTSYTENSSPVRTDTSYDMASLSKLMSTTMITLRFIADGIMDLADTLPHYLGNAVPKDKEEITLFQLMTHTSGFPAHIMLSSHLSDSDAVTDFLLHYPLEYVPGTRVVYSCMGFILLGKILEKISGKSLDILAREQVFEPLGMNHTGYHRIDGSISTENTVYTERDAETGNWLCGQVHDENARFLNGVAGNAGIFSTLEDCIRFASMLSSHGTLNGEIYLPKTIFDTAIQNYTPGMGENRGLGFHLANGYQSYSGQFSDQKSFGHTGFTGTHMLVSPESGLYVILLTNRVHPTRDNLCMLRIRKILHTLATAEYDLLINR